MAAELPKVRRNVSSPSTYLFPHSGALVDNAHKRILPPPKAFTSAVALSGWSSDP